MIIICFAPLPIRACGRFFPPTIRLPQPRTVPIAGRDRLAQSFRFMLKVNDYERDFVFDCGGVGGGLAAGCICV